MEKCDTFGKRSNFEMRQKERKQFQRETERFFILSQKNRDVFDILLRRNVAGNATRCFYHSSKPGYNASLNNFSTHLSARHNNIMSLNNSFLILNRMRNNNSKMNRDINSGLTL